MDAMESLARGVANRSSGFATQTMKQTTASCQTGGKLLADRSLSRLLKSDWPRTLDELETLKRNGVAETGVLLKQA
jgi:hypothetical protein